MIEKLLPVGVAWAQQGAQPGASPGGGVAPLIFLVIFFGLMYFMLLRPQMKRAKEHRELLKALKKGDEVVVNGAFLGRIIDMGENFLLLELNKNMEVRVQKQAISAVLPKGSMKTL